MDTSTPKLNTISRLRYQYEVTFGLYMLTTVEKIILSNPSKSPFSAGCPSAKLLVPDLIFVSIFTMFLVSVWVYLPSHIDATARHLRYYLLSDDVSYG